MSKDPLLRTVYFELINVLYAEGGEAPSDPSVLSDLLLLPADEVEKRLTVLSDLGSIVIDGPVVRQPRVSRELKRCQGLSVKRSRAARQRWQSDEDANAVQTDANAVHLHSFAMHTAIGIGTGIGTGKGKGTWLTPFGEAWVERAGGEPPWERLAKELAPVHKRFGEEVLLAGWRRYLAETEPRYLSPSAFARRIGAWVKIPPKAREVIPKPALPVGVPGVAKRWREACERVEMPPHLRRTWLSPTDARCCGDDGVLRVIVPSKEHAAALRRYEARLLAAYNDANFYDDAPARSLAPVVVIEDGGLHDGGL